MKLSVGIVVCVLFFTRIGLAQKIYPRNYFRHPLDIPMQLVANFGEIRTNHWHMGLDIRTQHKVNIPVYAAADGYIARVSVEPGGFGQAIYIRHPNGYTTLYGHLNSFAGELGRYVKEQQYRLESWVVDLAPEPGQFPVKKGQLIALSGSTGGSEGPHVHFEIRDSETENCLNPLLFQFPVADQVPPSIHRLLMYDRNRSTYAQTPQALSLKKSGAEYSLPARLVRVGSDRISFAIGAADHFNGSSNPNGIYSAAVFLDGVEQSGFALDDISYNDTRYINAQLDYPLKSQGVAVQHITPLPGAMQVAYHFSGADGCIHLDDTRVHDVLIEVKDAAGNTSRIRFQVQYDAQLSRKNETVPGQTFSPNQVNVFESDNFELYTTEKSMYDTVAVIYSSRAEEPDKAISDLFSFLNPSIPVHDQVMVRIRASRNLDELQKQRIVIRNISGSRTLVAKASWQSGWVAAPFRQFGNFQAFVDDQPPVINNPPSNIASARRIVFFPSDNFHSIRNFRAELDGKWLRFTNDKGKSWIYVLDEKFPAGKHQLKVHIEDEAGNVTEKTWTIQR